MKEDKAVISATFTSVSTDKISLFFEARGKEHLPAAGGDQVRDLLRNFDP